MPLCISGSILEISYQIYLDPCGSHGVRRFTNWCEILLGDAQKPSADGETDSNNRKILLILLVHMSHEFVKSQRSLRTWRFFGEFSMTILRFVCKPWLATVGPMLTQHRLAALTCREVLSDACWTPLTSECEVPHRRTRKSRVIHSNKTKMAILKNSRVHWSSV